MTDGYQVHVRDTRLSAPPSEEEVLTLFFPSQTVTARQLVRERVFQEVQAYNERQPAVFRGLVAPTGAERLLNGFRLPVRRHIDAQQQFDLACQAFYQNGFILLVDDRQVEELDEMITLQHDTSVVFLKLTPLVGG